MVIDTHVFLWYATNDSRLPKSLREKLDTDKADVHVPSICLWESMLLHERGRIQLHADNPGTELGRLLRESQFNPTPITVEIAIQSRALAFNHQDPADRFIAATAYCLNEPLATLDARLRSLPWLRTLP